MTTANLGRPAANQPAAPLAAGAAAGPGAGAPPVGAAALPVAAAPSATAVSNTAPPLAGAATSAAASKVGAAPDVSPHSPETGRMRRLLGPFHVTGVFWYRFHAWGARSWPASCHWMVISFFTTFFFFTLFNIRRAVAANLVPVLGPCGFWRRQARIFRTFWNFAWCLTERYERLVSDHPFRLEADGELWRALSESGKGMILVTAHLGNWEVGSLLPAAREARAVHVVREAEADPRAQEYISGLIARRAGGLYTTHFAEDPRLGLELLAALRRGEMVALQGDRPRSAGRVSAQSLFGRSFPLPIGPAALARAAGVPLVPVFVVREGRRRYRCELRPPIEVPSTADRDGDLGGALRRFAAEVEGAIARRPHQWYCFRKLWPDQAPR
jgi:lauroyl/myristoyl acyltransferase